jgi:hypothetical protein
MNLHTEAWLKLITDAAHKAWLAGDRKRYRAFQEAEMRFHIILTEKENS